MGSHYLAVTAPFRIAHVSELVPSYLLILEQSFAFKAHNAHPVFRPFPSGAPFAGEYMPKKRCLSRLRCGGFDRTRLLPKSILEFLPGKLNICELDKLVFNAARLDFKGVSLSISFVALN